MGSEMCIRDRHLPFSNRANVISVALGANVSGLWGAPVSVHAQPNCESQATAESSLLVGNTDDICNWVG